MRVHLSWNYRVSDKLILGENMLCYEGSVAGWQFYADSNVCLVMEFLYLKGCTNVCFQNCFQFHYPSAQVLPDFFLHWSRFLVRHL